MKAPIIKAETPSAQASIRVPLFKPDFGQAERNNVAAVFDSGWIAMGPFCERFEEKFAAYVGTKHALAMNSCTAALHIAYLLAGVGRGDEVIVPSLTFVATANTVAYTGATPIFADITSETDWTISVEHVERLTTPRTKAIAVMHYAGYPCDMNAIRDLAQARGLAVIEDACHGLGGTFNDRAMGALGDIGCFSFYSNKVITTGEGGMLVTDDDALAARGRLLRSHGLTASAYDRMRGAMGYDVVDLGYNYRLDDLRAAVGLAQMSRLDQSIARRRALIERYRAALERIPEVRIPAHGSRGRPAHYILPIMLDRKISRDRVRVLMLEQGIQTSIHYPPVHTLSHYCDRQTSLPVTMDVCARMMTLPLYPALTEGQVDIVCGALQDAIHATQSE